MTLPAPRSLRIRPEDEAVLAERARSLAGAGEAEAEARTGLFVGFGLAGRKAAVALGAVELAVPRLGEVVALAGGAAALAFVGLRPVPVIELAASLGAAPRTARELQGLPAIVLRGADGPVALVVEPPLDLLDTRLAERLDGGAATSGGLRLLGRSADDRSIVDPAWLLELLAARGAGT